MTRDTTIYVDQTSEWEDEYDFPTQKRIFQSVMREQSIEQVEQEARLRGRVEGTIVMSLFVAAGFALASIWPL